VIAIMGQPEDYAAAEESYNDSSYSYQRNNTNGKKLFRDGDDKFLGGVCSGIGHYFNIDVIWIRIIFIVLIASAFSPLAYVILWILLPEAKTTAEKLRMEGEPVNIDNIERKIRDEFSNVSENVRNAANNASEKLKDGANEFSEKIHQTFKGKTKKNNGLEDFLNTLGKIALVFLKVIGKFIGVILVFVAAAVILTLVIGGFSVGSLEFLNFGEEMVQYPEFFYASTLPMWLLTLFLFLLVGIPFIILFVLGLRILSSSVKQFNKTTSLTLLGIWIIALLGIIFAGLEFGTTHANYGQSVERNTLNIRKNDTLTLKVKNDDTIYYRHNLRRSSRKYKIEVNDKVAVYSNDIKIDVQKSTTEEAYIILQKESRGRTRFMANKMAEKITYKYEIIGNELILDAFFLSEVINYWKDEEIDITIFLPESTSIYFDNSIKNFIYDIKNDKNIRDKDMLSRYFIMGKNKLNCTDCIEEIPVKDEIISTKKGSKNNRMRNI
jgi:phage shock protein PspC (stress-responsive transcriptional regulator)